MSKLFNRKEKSVTKEKVKKDKEKNEIINNAKKFLKIKTPNKDKKKKDKEREEEVMVGIENLHF